MVEGREHITFCRETLRRFGEDLTPAERKFCQNMARRGFPPTPKQQAWLNDLAEQFWDRGQKEEHMTATDTCSHVNITELVAAGGPANYYDRKMPGLFLRVPRDECHSSRWVIRWRMKDGRVLSKIVGTIAVPIATARARADEILRNANAYEPVQGNRFLDDPTPGPRTISATPRTRKARPAASDVSTQSRGGWFRGLFAMRRDEAPRIPPAVSAALDQYNRLSPAERAQYAELLVNKEKASRVNA